MKRFLVLLIVAALAFSLPACKDSRQSSSSESSSSRNSSGESSSSESSSGGGEVDYTKIGDYGGIHLPLDNKFTKITLLVASSIENVNDLDAVQQLRKVTGVNVQLMPIPVSSIRDKIKMLVASNDLPDILGSDFQTNDIDPFNDFGVQGAFAPVDGYMDMLPNLKKIIDEPENQWYMKAYQAADKHVYFFPRYDCTREVNHGFLYRKDIFDKHGISQWNNKEEFYQALKKLKEIYPDSTPYVSKAQAEVFNQWSISWGLNASSVYYDRNEGLWKISAIDPKYKDMIDFMRKLYVEKLIDPEFLTSTSADWTTKMTNKEQAFTTYDWIGRLDMFYEQARESVPEYDLRYAYPIGPTGNIAPYQKLNYGSLVSNNKNQELSMRLLDYLISPSGAQLSTLGIEGKTYVFDENGKVKYLGFAEDKIIGIADLEEKYGLFTGGFIKRMDRRSVYFNLTEKEQEATDMIVKENRFTPDPPIILFNSDQKNLLTEYKERFEKAAQEFSMKYVLGTNTGDDAWREWLETAKKLNADRIAKLYNNAQE